MSPSSPADPCPVNRVNKALKCGILNCENPNVSTVTLASPNVLTFFGKSQSSIVKVCEECVQKFESYQEATQAIRSGQCLFSVKGKPLSNVAHLKAVNRPADQDRVVYEVPDDINVDAFVKKTLKRFDLNSQIESCRLVLKKELNTHERDLACISKELNSMDNLLSESFRKYNSLTSPFTYTTTSQELHINADGSTDQPRSRVMRDQSPVRVDYDAQAGRGSETTSESSKNKFSNVAGNGAKKKISKSFGIETAKAKSLVPQQAAPRIGDTYYALYDTLLSGWFEAKIVNIFEDPQRKQNTYAVRIKASGENNIVTLKGLAYEHPSQFLLLVGFRVIAKFTNNNVFYAGIVAETPKAANNMRYLILFDDGDAQYTEMEDIRLVCDMSKEVWEDVHEVSREFVKAYLLKYPHWNMVSFRKGSYIHVEFKGAIKVAQVLATDASMVRLRWHEKPYNYEEWVYRGSPRFPPIYNRLLQEGEVCTKGKVVKNGTKALEFQRSGKSTSSVGASARGNQGPGNYASTGRANTRLSKIILKKAGVIFDGAGAHLPLMYKGIEFEGTLKKLAIPDPDEVLRPKRFLQHECSRNCLVEYIPSKQLKRRSPLAFPLYFGWERQICETPRLHVIYWAPCGRRLTNYEDLNRFIDKTDCFLSIQHFNFHPQLDCLIEFEPCRVFNRVKDISYGKEKVPIECVNSVNHDTLPYMDYIPSRIAGPGVNLNTDDAGFLVCCDCTDNCEDVYKCACRQLTQEGIERIKNYHPNFPTIGYVNKKLKNHIISGIYECNSRCSCKQSCSNRVVQNGVIWPVQVFKTVKKGWGVRTLCDVPSGSFLCEYTGCILNEESANEQGRVNGDEYLADLDFIEIAEEMKDGYESDVPELQTTNAGSAKGTCGKTKRKVSQPKNCRSKKKLRLRNLYGSGNELPYIMDAKNTGNFGRYLNHSCMPNVIVQNVFVDTQDLRYPVVAFFTNSLVKAGTELCWDYKYTVGSVPGKQLICYCMASNCRRRLL